MRTHMGGIIKAMVKTLEMRDLYTAGHQQRVSNLSRAIAHELELPPEQIERIRSAATIHDIGKIAIPAEILSKPAALTDSEYGIIKAHPQIGFDIISGIDGIESIALTVLQHHERLDGSGYPNGLTDDEMLFAARIIAVADVVEAMNSHRPYRAALGIDRALDEISQNKGVLYDADVVETCTELFEERGFDFGKTGLRYSETQG